MGDVVFVTIRFASSAALKDYNTHETINTGINAKLKKDGKQDEIVLHKTASYYLSSFPCKVSLR